MNIIQEYLTKYQKPTKKFPSFKTGDTIRVHQKIIEGKKERVQIFEGLVIAKKRNDVNNCTIIVRKISNGVGVERIFPLNAGMIVEIDVVKKAKVRRSKLYYMRNLSGKKARLKETRTMDKTIELEVAVPETVVEATTEIVAPEIEESIATTEVAEAVTTEAPATEETPVLAEEEETAQASAEETSEASAKEEDENKEKA